MTDEQRERAIEEAASAFRERDVRTGRILPCPAWYDLDESGRSEAFEVAFELRLLEAALDPDGLSNTSRAVLNTISGT